MYSPSVPDRGQSPRCERCIKYRPKPSGRGMFPEVLARIGKRPGFLGRAVPSSVQVEIAQRLALRSVLGLAQGLGKLLLHQVGLVLFVLAVFRISHDRMSDHLEMPADLMQA